MTNLLSVDDGPGEGDDSRSALNWDPVVSPGQDGFREGMIFSVGASVNVNLAFTDCPGVKGYGNAEPYASTESIRTVAWHGAMEQGSLSPGAMRVESMTSTVPTIRQTDGGMEGPAS